MSVRKFNPNERQMLSPKYHELVSSYVELNHQEAVLIKALNVDEPMGKDLALLIKIAERKLSQLNCVRQLVGECQSGEVLRVEKEPDNVVVVNKYLNVVEVKLAERFVGSERRYQVRIFLCLTPSNAVVVMTSDTVQPILQGRTVQGVINGVVKFDRVKIMEVSSNYPFQSFRLLFQLEDITDETAVRVGNPLMSAPVQVIHMEKRKYQEPVSADYNNKRMREDSQYVEITGLLVLPQKDAAAKLGISESMLCKRFKESTRRKWPYRYLRKIEKLIQKMESSDLTNEELKKLDYLREERSSCLQPLKIRVTGRTSLEDFPLEDIYTVSTYDNVFIKKPDTTKKSDITTIPQTDSSEASGDENDNDIEIENIALALQSLKNVQH